MESIEQKKSMITIINNNGKFHTYKNWKTHLNVNLTLTKCFFIVIDLLYLTNQKRITMKFFITLMFIFSFSLVQDRFYNFNVLNGSEIVYKGRIFCTDQVIKDYSINNGVYTQHESTNEYIVYNE